MEIIHIRQPHRKTYALQFDREGNLVIKTNMSFSQSMVSKLITKHQRWIDTHHEIFARRNASLQKRSFKHGELFTILGKEYVLTIHRTERKTSRVEFSDHEIRVLLGSIQRPINSLVEHAIRKAAKEIFTARVIYFNKFYGFDFNNVTVKDQRSKWGSCSSKGNLNFNWKLLFGPPEILDYVVIHELCHLKEMNHGAGFWALVSEQCPEHTRMRKWLKIHGYQLQQAFDYQPKIG